MNFDVNVENVRCKSCGKTINRDDKFIFISKIHMNLAKPDDIVTHDVDCFCSTKCVDSFNSTYTKLLFQMSKHNRKLYMFSLDQQQQCKTDHDFMENRFPILKAFEEFAIMYPNKKYNHVYIERDATLNGLQKRQKEQMEDD